MAEKIISPGVFTKEVDQTFLPAAISEIGAAVIGPTVKGPALVPTVVTSYSEFQTLFGDSFKSGSDYYQYLTSHTAENYLKNASQMTVVRILDGTYGPATGSIVTSGSTSVTPKSMASGGLRIATLADGERFKITSPAGASKIFIASADGSGDSSDGTVRFFTTGATLAAMTTNLITEINAEYSDIKASNSGSTGASMGSVGIQLSGSQSGSAYNGWIFATASKDSPATYGAVTGQTKASTKFTTQGGSDNTGTSETAITIETLADGEIMNNYAPVEISGSNSILISGSEHNLRWEITNANYKRGTFSLIIRRGNDSIKRKQILETWNNLSLDPRENNFISKIIGDQTLTIRGGGTSDPYLQLSGSYPRKSNYVRVKFAKALAEYLDENGSIRDNSLSASIPALGSGSYQGTFGGGLNGYAGFNALGKTAGTLTNEQYNFYDGINSTNTQGFHPNAASQGKTAYEDALNLLSNQDEYDINMILIPGIMDNLTGHGAIITKAIDVCEDRGDCFVIVDPVSYSSALTTATSKGDARDSNYAAMYWPWVQVPDNINGKNRWVPPSVVMGGIYSFNDKVAHPWFAPAGLNRGGLDTVIQAERKLTNNNRDTLYESNINPIATFPGQGVTVFGQKTLQKKASALDRINVRRLLIALKKFIASSSRFLVFEQNNTATRRRFLNIVNPYLEQVQSNSGLTAFKVVMDESNNTPDVVDRNILYGQIFVQPTRTAEFIVLDFTVQPTGATFPE